MGRKSLKEEQQKRIIEAVYQIAKREGLENTSFQKVAKELDMNPSLIVHYFSNKEEMMIGLIDFIINSYQMIYEVNTVEVSALHKLKRVLDAIFSRQWNQYIDDSVFYSCFAFMFRNPSVRLKFYELHKLLRKWLEEMIVACVQQGEVRCEQPALVADLIFVISDGAYYYLSMIAHTETYRLHMDRYKAQALLLLGIED